MRMRLLGLLALLTFGCQSYELRRQDQMRHLRMSARNEALKAPPAAPVAVAQAPAEPKPVLHQPPVHAGSPLAQAGPPLAPTPPVNPAPVIAPPVNPAPAPVIAPPAAPVADVEQAEPASDKLAQLHQRAVQRYAGMDSYIARLRRTEEVNGKVEPEELALFKFRKEPWSVYFKWLGPEGKGREATYVKGRYDDKLHTLLAAGDVPLMPAGKVMSLDPHGYLVRANSRHPITEAGIGALIDRFTTLVRQYPQTITYQGSTRKPEFAQPLDEVLQTIPPGLDPQLPRGGTRRWYFDTQSGLPVMIVTWNDNRQLVESYAYEQLMFPVKLDDADFDPAVLWKKD